MLLQPTQNETADIGFLRNIGFAFTALTMIAGSVTVGLFLKQDGAWVPVTVASNVTQPAVVE